MMAIIVKRDIVIRDVRARMIEGAIRLLAQHGLQATSFAEVLGLTGAPRGSIYHHFPEGKDQLIGAAVDLAGAHALTALDDKVGASAEEITASSENERTLPRIPLPSAVPRCTPAAQRLTPPQASG